MTATVMALEIYRAYWKSWINLNEVMIPQIWIWESIGIWLMPVMPSVTYHKYGTTDYENIDPQYGTLETFQELLTACHDRGIRVILDLAMNHSSSSIPGSNRLRSI